MKLSKAPAPPISRILFISDPGLPEEVGPLLRESGVETQCFAESIGAVAVALRSNPSLIVIAVDRPLVDGTSLCGLVRRHRALEAVPVLLFATRTEAELRRLAIEHRAQGFVLPGSARAMAGTVLDYLRQRRPHLPADEAQRLEKLRGLQAMDTQPEPLLQDLCRLASLVAEVPVALVSLVDEDRQWFKARVGIDAAETCRDVAFCAHAIHKDELFVINDALEDPRFAENPLVVGPPHIRFYAGAPLTIGAGPAVGTLCVVDQRPRTLGPTQSEALKLIARQVLHLLEKQRRS